MKRSMVQVIEPHHQSLLSRRQFAWRLGKFGLVAFLIGFVSLLIGMWGYRFFESQSWPEAFLNSAMLLGAMGPVSEP